MGVIRVRAGQLDDTVAARPFRPTERPGQAPGAGRQPGKRCAAGPALDPGEGLPGSWGEQQGQEVSQGRVPLARGAGTRPGSGRGQQGSSGGGRKPPEPLAWPTSRPKQETPAEQTRPEG